MPTIAEMEYGYDSEGISTFLSEIDTTYLSKAKAAIRDISEIKTTCETEWAGKSRENFLTNLATDAEHVCTQLDSVYKILCSEVKAVGAAMARKDHDLISVE